MAESAALRVFPLRQGNDFLRLGMVPLRLGNDFLRQGIHPQRLGKGGMRWGIHPLRLEIVPLRLEIVPLRLEMSGMPQGIHPPPHLEGRITEKWASEAEKQHSGGDYQKAGMPVTVPVKKNRRPR